MKRKLLKTLLSAASLGVLLSIESMVPAMLAQTVPARIDISVVDGEGAINGTRRKVSRDPAVKVEDDDHRAIAGAAVVFALPVSGTTGEFSDGSKVLTVLTDRNGVATAHGLKTNDVPGKLQILVTASHHGLRSRTLITQTVEGTPGAKVRPQEVRPAKLGGSWKWALLGVAAAGAGGAGIYFGTQKKSTSTPGISISAGSVAFGSPR